MNSRRAALPRSSQAHGSGASPCFQIEKSTSLATTASCWRLSTRPRSRDGTPARARARNSCGRCETARTSASSSAAPRIVWRRPIGDWASSPSRSAGRQDPAHALTVEHGHVLDARRPACPPSPRSPAARPAPSGPAARDRAHGRVGRRRRRATTAARTSASVTIAQPVLADRINSAETPSSPSRSSRVADRLLRLAEDRRAHDRRHRRGADVEQAVHGLAGSGHALAHRLGHVGRPGLGGQDLARRRRA